MIMLTVLLLSAVSASARYLGDVNGDGSITISDVSKLINIVLGKDNDYEPLYADVNQDGTIDVRDVAAIVSILLGNSEPVEVGETNPVVEITEARGWQEYAYVKFNPFDGANIYNVYVKGG